MFIFKAMHMVGLHNFRAGGSTRDRLMTFSDYSIQAICERFSPMYLFYMRAHFYTKLFLFEQWFWAYERFYGFLRVTFDKESFLSRVYARDQKESNTLVESSTGAVNRQ